jgi:hypothetical protein
MLAAALTTTSAIQSGLIGAIGPSLPNWAVARDVEIQQRMADLAAQMLQLTWAQFTLGIVGTAGLLYTLLESRKATAAAMRAVRVQQTAERGVLVITSTEIWVRVIRTDIGDGGPVIKRAELIPRVTFSNKGKSIALIRSCSLVATAVEPVAPEYPASRLSAHEPLDPEGTISYDGDGVRLTAQETEAHDNAGRPTWLYGNIRYQDLFGEEHQLCFAYHKSAAHEACVEFGGDAFWKWG